MNEHSSKAKAVKNQIETWKQDEQKDCRVV